MKRNTLSIVILSITAALLLAGHWFTPATARAAEAVKDRDYQIVTARVQSGGEGLYVLDNRTGQVAVFTYDAAARGIKLRQVRMIGDAFQMQR